jgi:hypothetical protein
MPCEYANRSSHVCEEIADSYLIIGGNDSEAMFDTLSKALRYIDAPEFVSEGEIHIHKITGPTCNESETCVYGDCDEQTDLAILENEPEWSNQ